MSELVGLAGWPLSEMYRCIKCGATWMRTEPMPELGFMDVSWSVRSPTHGACCEYAPEMDLIMIPLDAEPL